MDLNEVLTQSYYGFDRVYPPRVEAGESILWALGTGKWDATCEDEYGEKWMK